MPPNKPVSQGFPLDSHRLQSQYKFSGMLTRCLTFVNMRTSSGIKNSIPSELVGPPIYILVARINLKLKSRVDGIYLLTNHTSDQTFMRLLIICTDSKLFQMAYRSSDYL